MSDRSVSINISLDSTEALVLFEYLASRDGVADAAAPDPAQQKVLWKVEGQLESALPDVLAPDYNNRVVRAKQAILGTDT